MYKYCEVFHTVHFRIAIISLIFQLNAYYTVEYIYFITTSLLQVSVCIAPCSGRTSYHLI